MAVNRFNGDTVRAEKRDNGITGRRDKREKREKRDKGVWRIQGGKKALIQKLQAAFFFA